MEEIKAGSFLSTIEYASDLQQSDKLQLQQVCYDIRPITIA